MKINMLLIHSILYLWISFGFSYVINSNVDVIKSLVWGPGISAELFHSFPVPYIFMQTVDRDGNNVTEISESAFSIDLQQKDGSRYPARTQMLQYENGIYVGRYRLFRNIPGDLLVNVKYNGRHVSKSPYMLKAPVSIDNCHCPFQNMSQWMQSMGCSDNFDQIQADLKPFPIIDMHEASKIITNRLKYNTLVHYVIKENKVYRKIHGTIDGFKQFSDNIILSLTRKVNLPDVEFFMNLGDYPLIIKTKFPNPVPIVSWCGSDDSHDLVIPTYDITESTLLILDRQSKDILAVLGNDAPPWNEKIDKAFFRGRDSRRERLNLILLSQKYPEIINASLTNMFFFKDEKEKYGELVKHISFHKFFDYKYQINMDGTVAAYRLPYLLAGNSLVLKQDSPFYEHFYDQLKPYVHYVPFKRDLSDLLDKIEWAQQNENKVQTMIENAQNFVKDNLLAKDIFCYHAVFFKKLAERLKGTPQVQPDMEHIPQPDQSGCNCFPKTKSKDEL